MTFGHVFLRRCGNLGVLNGGLLDAVGGLVDLIGAVGRLLLLAVAIDGLGLGLEAVDLGLGLGDVLRDVLVSVYKRDGSSKDGLPLWSCSPGSPSRRRASPSASRRQRERRSAAWEGRR